MKNDSKTKTNAAGGVELKARTANASPAAVILDGDFALTINFLTRRVRALIIKVGSRKPTAAEQREAQELQGRLAALSREDQKLRA